MNSQAKLERLIRLMFYLSTGTGHTIREIAEYVDLTERTAYRYLELFRDCGLMIENNDGFYHLSKNDKKGYQISELLHFSEEEAYLLMQAIHSLEGDSQVKQNLVEKLYSLYRTVPYTPARINKEYSEVIRLLCEAIEKKKQAILASYRSSSSSFIRDRLVEPFAFTTNFADVWCYEPESGMNKVFKTARIGEVKIYDRSWQSEPLHHQAETDVFRIYSHERHPVKLKLTLRSCNLLCEEYPMAREHISKVNDNEYIYKDSVCSYDGVGRFVMGLMDEIEVVETKDFINYLYQKIAKKKF